MTAPRATLTASAALPPQRTSVQALELLLIAGAALAVAAVLVDRSRHHVDPDHVWPRLLVGIVPGIVGVVLILVPNVDLIPDEWEGGAWIAVAAVTALLVLVAMYRRSRH